MTILIVKCSAQEAFLHSIQLMLWSLPNVQVDLYDSPLIGFIYCHLVSPAIDLHLQHI